MASDCESSKWVYNAIKNNFRLEGVIIEKPVSKKTLFRNRMKKIGMVKVLGQALFSILVVPYLRKKAASRRSALIKEFGLVDTGFDASITTMVYSVNEDSCLHMLKTIQPDIVIVNGTRIINKRLLTATKAIFINMHMGITPQYRGSHGGYWALYNKDEKNFGTTIHFIDTGVDTGDVLKQIFVQPSKEDNFTTYPILQVAAGIKALKTVVHAVMNENYGVKKNTEKGKMYYQPTIWQYFLHKI